MTATDVHKYSQAIDVQLDLAAFYTSPAGLQVVDAWKKMYRASEVDLGWDIDLARLAPVYLDLQIGRMLEDAGGTFPDDYRLHPDDLIVPHGFLLMEGPGVALSPPGRTTPLGYRQTMRGFAWSRTDKGIIFLSFGTSSRPDQPAELNSLNQINVVDLWNWGESIGEPSGASKAAAAMFATAKTLAGRLSPEEVERVVREFGPNGIQTASMIERTLLSRRTAYGIWQFMRQRITVLERRTQTRAGRRRMERNKRWSGDPVVQVIALRAKAHRRLEGVEAAERAGYSHRFIVRGHWRNQWFPSLDRHRPIWIEPFVKGPAGTPIAGGTKIYAVVR